MRDPGRTMFLAFFVLILSFVLSGCVGPAASFADDCIKSGGTPTKDGNGMDICMIPSEDAGEPCTDGSQCESECVAEYMEATIGRCYENTRFYGCAYVMRNGTVRGMLCE